MFPYIISIKYQQQVEINLVIVLLSIELHLIYFVMMYYHLKNWSNRKHSDFIYLYISTTFYWFIKHTFDQSSRSWSRILIWNSGTTGFCENSKRLRFSSVCYASFPNRLCQRRKKLLSFYIKWTQYIFVCYRQL